jgi:hypothetical protein
MRAYKFLDATGRAIYSGQRWPLPTDESAGAWVEGDQVDPCRAGVHGCRADDLSYWLCDELFEMELDGGVVESQHKVVAPRGRLARRVDAYPAAARELAAVSAFRARDVAVALLRDAHFGPLAARFEAAGSIDDLEALQSAVKQELPPASDLAIAAGMATDAAHFAQEGEAIVHSPFIAACAAGHAAAQHATEARTAFDAAFHTERRAQSVWLADRLDLR